MAIKMSAIVWAFVTILIYYVKVYILLQVYRMKWYIFSALTPLPRALSQNEAQIGKANEERLFPGEGFLTIILMLQQKTNDRKNL